MAEKYLNKTGLERYNEKLKATIPFYTGGTRSRARSNETNKVDADNCLAIGTGTTAGRTIEAGQQFQGALAGGISCQATGIGALSMGNTNNVSGNGSFSNGQGNNVAGTNSATLGSGNSIDVFGSTSAAIGQNNDIKGKLNIFIGQANITEHLISTNDKDEKNIIIGNNNTIDRTGTVTGNINLSNNIAIGNNNIIKNTVQSILLGRYLTATLNNKETVILGQYNDFNFQSVDPNQPVVIIGNGIEGKPHDCLRITTSTTSLNNNNTSLYSANNTNITAANTITVGGNSVDIGGNTITISGTPTIDITGTNVNITGSGTTTLGYYPATPVLDSPILRIGSGVYDTEGTLKQTSLEISNSQTFLFGQTLQLKGGDEVNISTFDCHIGASNQIYLGDDPWAIIREASSKGGIFIDTPKCIIQSTGDDQSNIELNGKVSIPNLKTQNYMFDSISLPIGEFFRKYDLDIDSIYFVSFIADVFNISSSTRKKEAIYNGIFYTNQKIKETYQLAKKELYYSVGEVHCVYTPEPKTYSLAFRMSDSATERINTIYINIIKLFSLALS